MSLKFISAEEAASFIHDGDSIGFSGFTAAGTPKKVSEALAKKAEQEHAAGTPFKVNIFTGASTSDHLDGVLARANAINRRTPYQSHKDSRSGINSHDISYFDLHLSHIAQNLRYGFYGKIDIAIIEAADVTPDGEIVLGTGVGIAPTVCQMADRIIIELNHFLPKGIRGFHDIYQPSDPPYRREIPIYKPSDRIGSITLKVDPKKIIGVVETNVEDGVSAFTPVDETTMKIGNNVSEFLSSQLKAGLIPSEFLPIQSGVGNIANAVLGCLGANPHIPAFEMYTEVIQDAVIGLMEQGRCKFASGCSLTVSTPVIEKIFSNIDFFRDKIVLRPGEITNNPEVARRMGLITINTALEADIYGNVNSTHVVGTKMMNGIGGSGDFTRNGYMSIFTTPSIAKGGKISSIVPMVSHVDHSEHSVDVIITELGVADLRGKSPIQRAKLIIENCVHPSYHDLLNQYLAMASKGHTPHNLRTCFAFHNEFVKSGDMSKVNWEEYK